MAKLQPLNEKVIIKRDAAEEVSKGGIVIPDKAQRECNRGEIVAVGQGKLLENGERSKMAVAPGDRVVFSTYCETIEVDGEELVIAEQSSILAVVQ